MHHQLSHLPQRAFALIRRSQNHNASLRILNHFGQVYNLGRQSAIELKAMDLHDLFDHFEFLHELKFLERGSMRDISAQLSRVALESRPGKCTSLSIGSTFILTTRKYVMHHIFIMREISLA